MKLQLQKELELKQEMGLFQISAVYDWDFDSVRSRNFSDIELPTLTTFLCGHHSLTNLTVSLIKSDDPRKDGPGLKGMPHETECRLQGRI